LYVAMRLRSRTSFFFPYPTLFRSRLSALERGHARVLPNERPSEPLLRGARQLPVSALRPGVSQGAQEHDDFCLRLGLLAAPALADRTSTRLNSSHVKSSYAVLCLK